MVGTKIRWTSTPGYDTLAACGFECVPPIGIDEIQWQRVLHTLDTGMNTELLSALALFVALPDLSLLCLGADRTKAILFPYEVSGLFTFAVPLPIIFWLGQPSAKSRADSLYLGGSGIL